jgi:hypothetical protein
MYGQFLEHTFNSEKHVNPYLETNNAIKKCESSPEVTHSYLRNDHFNIWFTIIAVDKRRIKYILDSIHSELFLEASHILNLPVKRLFKLDARFEIINPKKI